MAAQYEYLTPATVAAYIKSKPHLAELIDADHLADVQEVGDGNLNLVFIAKDAQGRGLVLKQALPYVRMTGEGWPMTPERARFEVDSLVAHGALTPELVVKVYDYEPSRFIIAMEDLSDHRVWRGALNEGLRHDGAARQIGTYVGALAFGTSIFGMDRMAYAEALAASVNPELCVITEDLVFTEPAVPGDRNSCLPANEADARELTEDTEFAAAMGLAKYWFMTHAEALVHGDLHTGSIMVRTADGQSGEVDSVKAFDSEFAFYGPLAFDLGACYANFTIAAARAYALGEDERARWCLSLIEQLWEGFEEEFRRRWPSRVDQRLWDEDFLDALITRWREEAWLFAAAKMSRRIVGAAKTKDIETLPGDLRAGAARGVLRLAREAVRARTQDSSTKAFVALAARVLAENRSR